MSPSRLVTGPGAGPATVSSYVRKLGASALALAAAFAVASAVLVSSSTPVEAGDPDIKESIHAGDTIYVTLSAIADRTPTARVAEDSDVNGVFTSSGRSDVTCDVGTPVADGSGASADNIVTLAFRVTSVTLPETDAASLNIETNSGAEGAYAADTSAAVRTVAETGESATPPPPRVGRAMVVLAGLIVVSVIAILYEQNGWTWPLPDSLHGAPSGTVAVGKSLAPLVIVSVATMVLTVEGGTMVADTFIKRRHAEAIAKRDAEWAAWLDKKEAAERDGKPFNEPPPSSSR